MNKKICLVLAMAFVSIMLSGCWITTEQGKHSGQITAIEKNGIFWKTWDVYIKSDISSSQEEHYCVEDERLIPILEQVSKHKLRVTLNYHSEFVIEDWRCTTNDIVDSVEVI